MNVLRRTLYLQAAVWAVSGAALAALPHLVLVTLFRQPPYEEYAWIRVVGAQALGIAMLMVMVAHRVEELWWWTWAFALLAVAVAAIVLLNAAFGLAPDEASAFWWVFSTVAVVFALSLLYGLFVTSRQNPLP